MKSLATTRYPQLAKEPLLTSYLKGNPLNRFWAKAVDLLIVSAFTLALSFLSLKGAMIVPLLLFPWMERMGRGQSPGKWILGLHTISIERGTLPGFYSCLLRNLPFIALCWVITGSVFWNFLFPTLALVFIGIDIYFIVALRSGLRFGDVLGRTRVFDYKDEHTKFVEEFLKEDSTA